MYVIPRYRGSGGMLPHLQQTMACPQGTLRTVESYHQPTEGTLLSWIPVYARGVGVGGGGGGVE